MTKHQLQNGRRRFLQHMLSGAALAGSGMFVPQVFATNPNAFAFRQGQPELLLHFNENSLGMSPKALTAAQQAIALYGNRYPDDAVSELRQRLATRHSIDGKPIRARQWLDRSDWCHSRTCCITRRKRH